MQTLKRILLASSTALLAGSWAAPVYAQKDIQRRLPNVLLLVDNSGSMEYLMDPPGQLPGSIPGTACDGSVNLNARNRWANLVTALTGSISDADFSCRKVQRSGTAFLNEYRLDGNDPYDLNYFLPFHRVYSGNCAYGAGEVNANWSWWICRARDSAARRISRTATRAATPSRAAPSRRRPTACSTRSAPSCGSA